MQISYFPRTKWHSSSANNETPEAGSCMYLCSGPLASSNLGELTFRPESRSTVNFTEFPIIIMTPVHENYFHLQAADIRNIRH